MSTDSINRVVFRALHSRRASVQDTQGFGDLQHNDHLCPQLQSRLDDLLSSCKRNFNVVYDVQGFRDSGVDVVIRVSSDEDGDYIAFQIKADDELSASNLLSTFKTQHHDAETRYGKNLIHYYMVPCADLTAKGRRDRVRLICSEFANRSKVTILDPQYLWNFLYAVKSVDEQALVTAFVNDVDPLVMEASHLASSLNVVQLRTLLATLSHVVSTPDETLWRADLVSNLHISDALNVVDMLSNFGLPLDFVIPSEYQFNSSDEVVPSADDFDVLSEWIELDESDRVSFEGWSERPLVSLAYEASARYELKGERLAEYLESLLYIKYEPTSFTPDDFECLLDLVEDIVRFTKIEPVEVLERLLELNWGEPDDVLGQLASDDFDEEGPAWLRELLQTTAAKRTDDKDLILTWLDVAQLLLET